METTKTSFESPWWYNEESQKILQKTYLLQGETLDMGIDRIVSAACRKLKKPELYDSFREMIERGWMSLSSPIWANMGTERGLPISCFNVHIPDSVEGITQKLGEAIMQTKLGGGTSGYFGELRPRGAIITDNGKSSGAVSFMELFNTAMNVISQGSVRRGAFAAYLDIDHPDIEEFLNIKSIGSPIQNLFFGVCVPDYWMQEMIDGDKDKRKIWAKVLESRQQKGMPYIFYVDTANNNKPQIYTELGLKIKSSNLCSEIMLPSSEDESFVCCLASMNVALYEEWKNTEAVRLAIFFLDAVMQEFIDKTVDDLYMQSAHNFAKRHRALGLGVLGWHSYLQSKMLPFDSVAGKIHTHVIFKNLKAKSDAATEELAELYGPAPIYLETDNPDIVKRRNTTCLAIAPTTSSSAILGQVSPGVEPYSSNYYKAGLAAGNFMRKNKYLQKLLAEKGLDTDEYWHTIMLDGGSVQNLKELTQEEKEVFKTFSEIIQSELIEQAGIRQQYIDQAQSINVFVPSTIPVKEVNALMILAWKVGVKSVYYQRSVSESKNQVTSLIACGSCES